MARIIVAVVATLVLLALLLSYPTSRNNSLSLQQHGGPSPTATTRLSPPGVGAPYQPTMR